LFLLEPRNQLDRLTEETVAVMRDPVVVKQFTEQQLSVMVLERDRFADLIRKDTEKWGKVVKSAGIKME
jgi:tripartite-type tricarboxylate transporter receptor subunit TctC